MQLDLWVELVELLPHMDASAAPPAEGAGAATAVATPLRGGTLEEDTGEAARALTQRLLNETSDFSFKVARALQTPEQVSAARRRGTAPAANPTAARVAAR
jgi:hypothetical protein